MKNWARYIAIFSILVLSACALPRTGPTQSEIVQYAGDEENSSAIVPITMAVAEATQLFRPSSIGKSFRTSGVLNTEFVQPGDILAVTVYENVDDALIGSGGAPGDIVEIQVEKGGMIYLPYIGRVRATGKSTEQLRLLIVRKLEEQTPNPQVIIRRKLGTGATVSVVGSVAAQGVYPVDNTTLRLSGLIARAGGLSIAPDIARVTLLRGSAKAMVWVNDIYLNSSYDLALRPNDRVLVEEDPRQFTALGAVGGQRLVAFDSDNINLIEAIGMIGGLNGNASNPSGVFVFRQESSSVINKLNLQSQVTQDNKVVYLLDMKNPESLFAGTEFFIRDDDVVFVTEAPFTQASKVLQAVIGTAGSAQQISNIAQ